MTVRSFTLSASLLLLLFSVVFGAAGCAPAVRGACDAHSDCDGGKACVDGACVELCQVQSNCPANAVCGVDGYCVAPQDGPLPDITDVRGNDTTSDSSAIANGLLVAGSNLATARFELRGDAGAEPLEIAYRYDTSAELYLPQDIRSGTYTLVATNLAGEDQQPLTLQLPELTGNMIVERLNTEATEKLTFNALPVGTGSTEVARGDHDHDGVYARSDDVYTKAEVYNNTEVYAKEDVYTKAQVDALTNTNCPPSYIQDTSRTDIVLCTKGADEMVKVGDIWVDRYEASLWQIRDCTGTQYGASADNYPQGFPDNGNIANASDRLFACSKRGVAPSRHMTWFQAQQACAAGGKHLITNAEWQAAAAGTRDPGSSDGGASPKCNTDSAAGAPRPTGAAGNSPGGADSCISIHGAEDMVGNLWEWTASWFVTGLAWQTADAELAAAAWPSAAAWGSDGTWNLDGRSYNGSGWANGLPAPAVRGGFWGNGAAAGVFAVALNSGPSDLYGNLGARCARTR